MQTGQTAPGVSPIERINRYIRTDEELSPITVEQATDGLNDAIKFFEIDERDYLHEERMSYPHPERTEMNNLDRLGTRAHQLADTLIPIRLTQVANQYVKTGIGEVPNAREVLGIGVTEFRVPSTAGMPRQERRVSEPEHDDIMGLLEAYHDLAPDFSDPLLLRPEVARAMADPNSNWEDYERQVAENTYYFRLVASETNLNDGDNSEKVMGIISTQKPELILEAVHRRVELATLMQRVQESSLSEADRLGAALLLEQRVALYTAAIERIRFHREVATYAVNNPGGTLIRLAERFSILQPQGHSQLVTRAEGLDLGDLIARYRGASQNLNDTRATANIPLVRALNGQIQPQPEDALAKQLRSQSWNPAN